MQLYSTRNPQNVVQLKEAVMKSLAADGGLYLPASLKPLSDDFFIRLPGFSFNELAYEICRHLFNNYLPPKDLRSIIERAFNFSTPLVSLKPDLHSLELFHGPSLAFKDFGACFMSQLMSYFIRGENKKTTILVATSGDTGGAVASGFYEVEGIDVIILYPSGMVSPLQEKQLTTWGSNIHALEIAGSFDDCQDLVKRAFLDEDLNNAFDLSSANSINIARLIPQTFYYFDGFRQLQGADKVVFAVPSGNFGNLTAGYIAKLMGLPIYKFIAATNINKVVPDYISTGNYQPKASTPTLSNAMDVGNPSNFERLKLLTGSTWNNFKNEIWGYHLDDDQTKAVIKYAWEEYGYVCDPHGAIALAALLSYSKKMLFQGVFLETAHPSKFLDTVEDCLGKKIELPSSLSKLRKLDKKSVFLDADYNLFKEWMLNSY